MQYSSSDPDWKMGGLASSRQRTTAVSPPSRPLTELRGGEFPVHAWRQHQYSGRWDRVFQKRERSVDGAVTRPSSEARWRDRSWSIELTR